MLALLTCRHTAMTSTPWLAAVLTSEDDVDDDNILATRLPPALH